MSVLVVPFFCQFFLWFNERFAVATRKHEYAIVDRAFYDANLAKYEAR